MLELEGINYWAVGIAWFINVIVGALWYSPSLYGKHWQAYTGIDMLKIPQKEATKIIGFVALSALIQATTLAVVINSLDATTAVQGICAGIVLWLGFTTATTVGVTLYSRRSWRFLWLNSSYFLLVMVLNSVILATWH